MVRFFIFLSYSILHINQLTGIVIKQNPISSLEKVTGTTNNNVKKSVNYLINHREDTKKHVPVIQISPKSEVINFNIMEKKDTLKDLPLLSKSPLDHRVTTTLKNKRTPFFRKGSAYSISNSKPIYETNFDTDIDLFQQHKPDDYFYEPPPLNEFRLEKNLKNTKDSHTSNEIAKAIVTLDRHLKSFSNPDSHNNDLHFPTNPILALILSHYGRYLPGSSRLYSYMAVNNIHNHKPFGQYKYECDADPTYIR